MCALIIIVSRHVASALERTAYTLAANLSCDVNLVVDEKRDLEAFANIMELLGRLDDNVP